MKKFRYLAISLLLLFPFCMAFFPHLSPAHHTSSIAYVLREVGKKKVGNIEIELNAMPPRLIKRRNAPKSLEHTQAFISIHASF